MKTTIYKAILGVLLFAAFSPAGVRANPQSLAEAALKEAERRKLLEKQGIEGKVIRSDAGQLAPNANLTQSSPLPPVRKAAIPSSNDKNRASLQSLRKTLQKLDREIRKGEDRLEMLRTKLHDERWALPKVGRISSSTNSSDTQDRLRAQIQELELNLKYLRQERLETYGNGRKAGYLPGELDGKGIIP